MPFRMIDGYKFGFFSLDMNEQPHVHVLRAEKHAKIWLQPVDMEYNHGYNNRELNRVVDLTRRHQAELLEMWHEHFGQ